MNFKDIITKILNGEALTDAEKLSLETFDLDKQINKAAADARRKAESERDAAREELGKLKEDDESRGNDYKKLLKRVSDLEKDKAKAEADAKALQRSQTIEAIREKKNIRFADGISHEISRSVFANIFNGVDDLDDESVVSEKVNAFISENKGMLKGDGGFGQGANTKPNSHSTISVNPYDKKTFNLTKQIELSRINPEKARRFAEQANSASSKQ